MIQTNESTYRNTDTIYTEITETEDARSVSDDTDFGVGTGPVAQHGANRATLLDGDVQSLRAGVEGGVLEADITDGGSIYERHEVADVVHEKAVKEVNVLALDARQVQVLVNVCLARVNHSHGAERLSLQGLHGMRDEAGEVLGDAFLGSEGEALVPKRLAEDLVASGVGLVDILGGLVLFDLTIVVLGIAPMLIESGHLHCFLDGGYVDCGHGITVSKPAGRRTGTS